MRHVPLALGSLALLASITLADTAPPVPWTAAADHVRSLVTIEGVVARATTTAERRCVLEFDPNDPVALRVVLIIPLLTDLPTDPSRLYQDKRVQVTGRVTRFQGRLEMVVTPPQIEVVGLTVPRAAPADAPPPVAPAAPTPVPPVIPSAAPPSGPGAMPTPSAAPSAPSPPVPAPDPRCRGWQDDRTALRAELRGLAHRLDDCLAADRLGCAALGDLLGPPLSRLAAVEAHLDRHCP